VGNEPPQKVSAEEWKIFVNGHRLKDGWTSYDLSLPDEMGRTFLPEGWFYAGQLLRLRLRGSLSISPIDFAN
jgi:hypothetical protein